MPVVITNIKTLICRIPGGWKIGPWVYMNAAAYKICSFEFVHDPRFPHNRLIMEPYKKTTIPSYNTWTAKAFWTLWWVILAAAVIMYFIDR